MPEAEGKIINFNTEDAIRSDWLETLPYKGGPQLITYTTDEFSAVCPFSGLPDFGDLIVKYIPNRMLVELKSLKYYIISFRQVGIYQENATVRIYNDLKTLLTPLYLEVTTTYHTRGGIVAECQKASAPESTVEKALFGTPE